jgi:hypothetical protein
VILARRHAQWIGVASIALVVALQSFNGVACYHQNVADFLLAFSIFVAPAVFVALIALFTSNPLRAAVASLCFAPWLVMAYYSDCIAPYRGGGASMVYVVVVLYGLPCALLGAFIAGPLLRRLGVTVEPKT